MNFDIINYLIKELLFLSIFFVFIIAVNLIHSYANCNGPISVLSRLKKKSLICASQSFNSSIF